MSSLRVANSRRLVDVGGQEVSRSKSQYNGDDCIDDWLWPHKIAGDVVGFDEILVVCMARRGVVLYLA
jgi:hypothetical protein